MQHVGYFCCKSLPNCFVWYKSNVFGENPWLQRVKRVKLTPLSGVWAFLLVFWCFSTISRYKKNCQLGSYLQQHHKQISNKKNNSSSPKSRFRLQTSLELLTLLLALGLVGLCTQRSFFRQLLLLALLVLLHVLNLFHPPAEAWRVWSLKMIQNWVYLWD